MFTYGWHLAGGRYALLELNVLDTRQYRSDQVVGAFIAPRSPRASDSALTLTGDEQERWLLDNLTHSQARWNVTAQQTIMAQYDYDTGPGINHNQTAQVRTGAGTSGQL